MSPTAIRAHMEYQSLIENEVERNMLLQKEIDELIDKLPAKKKWVQEENKNMLKYQFDPKLALAQEKVDTLKT